MADVHGDGEEKKEAGRGAEERPAARGEKAAAGEAEEGDAEQEMVERDAPELWPKQEWGTTGGRRRGRTSKAVSEVIFFYRHWVFLSMLWSY